jgi:hypothetical protein
MAEVSSWPSRPKLGQCRGLFRPSVASFQCPGKLDETNPRLDQEESIFFEQIHGQSSLYPVPELQGLFQEARHTHMHMHTGKHTLLLAPISSMTASPILFALYRRVGFPSLLFSG